MHTKCGRFLYLYGDLHTALKRKKYKNKGTTMKTLSEAQIEKLFGETISLAKENCMNESIIKRNIHKLLDNSPGENLKIRAKYVTSRFKSKGISYSYLRKIILTAALEKELKLTPGTLKEFHARSLLEVKVLSQRPLIYNRALELADSEPVKSTHIEQAIKEITITKMPNEEKLSLVENTKPAKSKRGITSENAGKGLSKKSYSKIDNSHTSDEDEETEPITAQEIYQDIKPDIKTMSVKVLLVRVLKTSDNFWRICKKLIELELSANETKELIKLVDPSGECQAIISANVDNKTSQHPISQARKARVKQHHNDAPVKGLFNN
jgi:hypothetical protein